MFLFLSSFSFRSLWNRILKLFPLNLRYSIFQSQRTSSPRRGPSIGKGDMAFKPAIASMSLGRAWAHDIHTKFHAAAAAGLPGIEIFFEDLLYLADTYPSGGSSLPSNQIRAAHEIRALADSLNLALIACGPFSNCEGVLDPVAKEAKLRELELWFEICHVLGTDIIQIPCTYLTEGMTGELDIVVSDLREVADLGARQDPPFRFAFENLCFGTFFDTWEKAWEVIKLVDRDNFGFCLDTYNICGREFGDPAVPSGKIPNAEESFRRSMKKFVETVDVNKVFYVQVVDGERLDKVLDENHEWYVKEQKPRMTWSRNARLFICEEERGGYLPAVEVVKAITEGLGYKGWISMELFNRSLTSENPNVPQEHAERAMQSWRKLEGRMGWDLENSVPIRSTASRAGKGVLAEEIEVSARL